MVLDAQKVEDKATMTKDAGIEKLLIVAPNWIGDTVLALPAISRIRDIFPASSITVLGLPHICELFKESPFSDNRMIHSDTLLATVHQIKKEGFDLAILFPNSFRTALLVYLARIPLRCGYNRDGRGVMLNMGIKTDAQIGKLSQSEYYLNMVNCMNRELAGKDKYQGCHPDLDSGSQTKGSRNKFGVTDDGKRETVFSGEQKKNSWLRLNPNEVRHATKILYNYNVPAGSLIIGINPGAAYGSAKRWYPERFAGVCSSLVKKYKAEVIIFGSQQEASIAGEIEHHSTVPVVNMAGKTTIRELMALIKQCSLFITNDSGPMHIAAALNIPVVAIFGSTDPDKTGPLGDNHVIIRKKVDCSPCFKRKCPTDLRCMDLITVEDLLSGVDSMLG